MITKHTALPWSHCRDSSNIDLPEGVPTEGTIYGAGWHLALVFSDGGLGTDTAQANAKLIVTAVNSHADLVGALRNGEQIIADFIGMYGDSGAGLVLAEIRAALAKASTP